MLRQDPEQSTMARSKWETQDRSRQYDSSANYSGYGASVGGMHNVTDPGHYGGNLYNTNSSNSQYYDGFKSSGTSLTYGVGIGIGHGDSSSNQQYGYGSPNSEQYQSMQETRNYNHSSQNLNASGKLASKDLLSGRTGSGYNFYDRNTITSQDSNVYSDTNSHIVNVSALNNSDSMDLHDKYSSMPLKMTTGSHKSTSRKAGSSSASNKSKHYRS